MEPKNLCQCLVNEIWDHYFMYIYVQTIFYTKSVFLSLKITIMSFEEKRNAITRKKIKQKRMHLTNVKC